MSKLIKRFGPYEIYLVEWNDKEDIEAIQRAKYNIYTLQSGRGNIIADTGILLDVRNKKEDCIFDKSPGTVYIVAARRGNDGSRIISAIRIVSWTEERRLPMENILELGNGYPTGFNLMPYMKKHGIDPKLTCEFGRYFKLPPEKSNENERRGLAYKYIGFQVMRIAYNYSVKKGFYHIFACAKPIYASNIYMPVGLHPIVIQGQFIRFPPLEEELYPYLEMVEIEQLQVRKGQPRRKIKIGKYQYPVPSGAEDTIVNEMKKYNFIPLHLDSRRAIERAVKGEFYGGEGETDLNEYFMLILTPESFPIYKKIYSIAMMGYIDLKERAIDIYRNLIDGPIPSREDIKINLP